MSDARGAPFDFIRWPRLLPPPPRAGVLRQENEDFEVEEIPAYPPCGAGEHLLLEIEKRNLTTDQVVRELSRRLRIAPGDIGTAGLKDRRAVARQWMSIPARAETGLDGLDIPGVRVLRRGRHRNKLRTGHLRGNRFRLRLASVDPALDGEVERRCQALRAGGAPNYFGPQRFGREGSNREAGIRLLRGQGRCPDRRRLRLLLNAVQSDLFNDLLALRIRRGLFGTVLAGDILERAGSGGMFCCNEPAVDQKRFDDFEIHITGPMFGPEMLAPAGQSAEMEREVLAASGLAAGDFERFSRLTRGTRRALRVAVPDLGFRREGDDLRFEFSLPPGAYATVVLSEILDWIEARAPAPEGSQPDASR
jgi:tRNA pseudouridine13 synthase